MSPKARTKNQIVQSIGKETVIYDRDRHRIHRLNHVATLVWRQCDGRTTVEQIANELQRELGESVPQDIVLLTLERLARARLIDTPAPDVPRLGVSRRELLRRTRGAGALALLLPIVATLSAPAPSQAISLDDTVGETSEGCKKRLNGSCGFLRCTDDVGVCRPGSGTTCFCSETSA